MSRGKRGGEREPVQRGRRAGFSLLELALGMAVLALIAGAATPVAVRYVRQEAGQKTARELLAVADAGKTFYVANNRWPTGIGELRAAGHLPTTFSQSAFGTTYTAAVNGSQLEVTIAVPSDLAAGVTRLLPLSRTAGSGTTRDITTAVSVPGTTSDTSVLLHRQGTLVNSTMIGPLEVADQSGSGSPNIRSLGASSTNVFEGNVGIGTTSPAEKLVIANGATTLSMDGSSGARLKFGTTGNYRQYLEVGAYNTVNNIDIKDRDLRIFSNSAPGVTVLASSGNVGVGTTTPLYPLTVQADPWSQAIRMLGRSSDNSSYLAVANNNGSDQGYLLGGYNAGIALLSLGNLTFYTNGNNLGDTSNITFRTIAAGGSTYLDRLTIASNGNVGIGQTNPSTALDVVGTITGTAKNFAIPHPSRPGYTLVHSTLEGPEVAVFYRGEAALLHGTTTVTLPPYFEALTRKDNRTVLLTNIDGFDPLVLKTIDGAQVKDGQFSVYSQNPTSRQRFNWEVKAIRADQPLLVPEQQTDTARRGNSLRVVHDAQGTPERGTRAGSRERQP